MIPVLVAVSPGLVKETLELWGMDNSTGIVVSDVVTYYQASINGQNNCEVCNAVGDQYKTA